MFNGAGKPPRSPRARPPKPAGRILAHSRIESLADAVNGSSPAKSEPRRRLAPTDREGEDCTSAAWGNDNESPRLPALSARCRCPCGSCTNFRGNSGCTLAGWRAFPLMCDDRDNRRAIATTSSFSPLWVKFSESLRVFCRPLAGDISQALLALDGCCEAFGGDGKAAPVRSTSEAGGDVVAPASMDFRGDAAKSKNLCCCSSQGSEALCSIFDFGSCFCFTLRPGKTDFRRQKLAAEVITDSVWLFRRAIGSTDSVGVCSVEAQGFMTAAPEGAATEFPPESSNSSLLLSPSMRSLLASLSSRPPEPAR
mmetsp:Transcript_57314/g.166338  ORF Transcript_57314/g.166338 Transcript_57314/m.166338 type:complete len:310 (+) Transcript_57314:403-1332(+)